MLKLLNKSFFFAIAAGVVSVFCIGGTTLAAHAAWDDSETGYDSATNGNVIIYAEKGSYKVPCDYEVVPLTDSSNYSCYQISYGEIYLNYSVRLTDSTSTQYLKGNVVAQDTLSLSGFSGGSYTVNNTSYECGLIYSSPGINVSFLPQGSGSYWIRINFDNLSANIHDEFGFTIVLRCYGRMYQLNNGSVSLPVIGNLVVGHSLQISNFTAVSESENGSQYDAVLSALDDSLSMIAIEAHTGVMETELGLIDNKIAQFLAQEAANDASLSSQLNNLLSGDIGGNSITSAGQILGLIYQKINSSSQSLSDADDQVNDAHDVEANLHSSIDNMVFDLGFDNGSGINYTNGLAQISGVNTSGFMSDHAVSFEFWRTVGNRALTKNTTTGWGAVAGFFMIVIILAFTVWVLHL